MASVGNIKFTEDINTEPCNWMPGKWNRMKYLLIINLLLFFFVNKQINAFFEKIIKIQKSVRKCKHCI